VRSKGENQERIGDIKAKNKHGKVIEDEDKAEVFARYFSTVFTQKK